MVSRLIWLAEITAITDSMGSSTTLRYASGEGYNAPDAPGFYDARIKQAANLERQIFQDLRTFGGAKVAFGELILVNPDGALDALINYGYGATGKILIVGQDDAYSTAVTVLEGTVEQPLFNFSEVRFRFRDRMQELTLPVQPAKFAGTNSGATGIEGLANDLEGKPKPRTFGIVKNVQPAPVNSSLLIYGLNFDRAGDTQTLGAAGSFDGVRDGGVALTFGTNRANLSAMQSSAPSAGNYDTCTAEGLIRLGATPNRAITCDVQEGADAEAKRAAPLIKRLLLDAGVSSGDIDDNSFDDVDSAAGYGAGIYVDRESSYTEWLDLLAASIGAFYGPDRQGTYKLQQLVSPAGSPVATFNRFSQNTVAKADDGDILSIERVTSADPGRGIPAQRVNLHYHRLGRVQPEGDLNTSVSVNADSRAYYEREFRTVTAADASVATQFAQAPELEFTTVLVDEADAQAEATRRLNLYKVRRDMFRLRIKFGDDTSLPATIDLGVIVKLAFSRFGLAAGKLFIVTGLRYNARAGFLDMTIWG